jgi:Carboxymuconolactone decarboxylase family
MSTPPTETPVLDLLATMTAASVEQSELDPRSLMLVRLAALAAVDAPSVSYLMNLAVASDVGVVAEDVEQVLIGIAPVVGTARVVSAGGKIARALGFAIAVAEAELEDELEDEEAATDD